MHENLNGNLATFKTSHTFDNVWDRRTLYIHSTIANTTPYNYLGHDNEFYQTPSKLYKWTSKSKTFRVWTSFDGETAVKLYWQPFLLQFQLIASCYR
jgi:DNA modification methylase